MEQPMVLVKECETLLDILWETLTEKQMVI